MITEGRGRERGGLKSWFVTMEHASMCPLNAHSTLLRKVAPSSIHPSDISVYFSPLPIQTRWVTVLSSEYPTLAFHSSLTNPFGKGSLIHLLRQFAKVYSMYIHVHVYTICQFVRLLTNRHTGSRFVERLILSLEVDLPLPCTVRVLYMYMKSRKYNVQQKSSFMQNCCSAVYPWCSAITKLSSYLSHL